MSAERESTLWPLAAICTGYFLVILDATIVNVALPDFARQLHASVSDLQWVVDSYTLVLAALLLTGGALSDRLGARRVFTAGLAIFVLASLACAVAPSIDALVGARLAQGVGGALQVPASLALLQSMYTSRTARARAVGVWGGVAGIAAASGPVLGGLLVGAVGWRAVFLVNVPVGLAGLGLASRFLPSPTARPGRNLDVGAQLVAIVSLSALTTALIEAGQRGFASPVVIVGLLATTVAAVAFVGIERRSSSPMLPLALFANRTFTGANTVGLLINLGLYGQLFALNLYLQVQRGYSPLHAGLALLPEAGMASIASLLSGKLTARLGSPRPTMLAGLLIGGAGMLGQLVAGALSSYALLVLPLLATGFGMAFAMPAAVTAVVEASPADHVGIGSGALNAFRQVGSVVGVALLGSVLAASGSLVVGLRVGLVIAGAAFLAACAVTYVTVERERPSRLYASSLRR